MTDEVKAEEAGADELIEQVLPSGRGEAVLATAPAGDPAVSDFALLRLAQRGDRRAFAAIIERHQHAIYGYLRSRLLEPADAEDLCQEVFLRSYTARVRFEQSTPLRPWLIGIARNLLHEHVRRIKRRKEVAWTEFCLDWEDAVDFQDEKHDTALAHLPACLGALGQSARQALDLRYQAKLRLAEIGEKLRRSEGAVKLLMFRARQALKHCLDTKTASRADD